MSDCYILDDNGNPVPADSLEWGRWLETPAGNKGRIVAQDEWVGDAHLISTVFLGLDYRFGGEGPPILWETMIFGGKHNDFQRRYTSRAQAVMGYPNNTVKAPAMAFAYGYVWALISTAAKHFEGEEKENAQTNRR